MGSSDVPSKSTAGSLGTWDVVSIIVGIIIGVTIFRTPASIFCNCLDQTLTIGSRTLTVPAMWVGLAAWLLVGLVSIIGALCYAELATAYPTTGGDYIFLTRAYGQGPGFLFAWAEMSIIRTGASIGAMAYVFADYANRVLPLKPLLEGTRLDGLGERPGLTYGSAAVVLIALINGAGLKPGKFVQNTLSLIKVLGLLAVILAGLLAFLWTRKAEDLIPDPKPVWPFPPSLALALVFVFYAYGGWHEAAYVASEVRDRRRNITRALVFGVGLVTIIYMVANVAYLSAFGLERLRASKLIAADVMFLPLGETGAKVISILIMISALGAINGLMFTGIRLYSTFGNRERLFAWLSRRGRMPVPLGALMIQVVFTLALLAIFETGDYWKPWFARLVGRLDIAMPESFTKKPDGFDDLVACTAPVFWLFFACTGFAVIALRGRDRGVERPFRVPLFPITPIIFCASSLFMLYRSTTYAMTQGSGELMVVGAFLLLGIPLYALSGPPRTNTTTTES